MKAPAAEVLPQVSIEGGEMISKTLMTVSARFALLITEDDGMSTAEYAIGTIAAAAFGAVLYTVVTGDSICQLCVLS